MWRLLESMENIPAFAVNRIGDIVATNTLGRAFYVQMYDGGRTPVNHTWFQFMRQQQSRAFWVDWDVIADNGVHILRAEVGAAKDNPTLNALVAELLQVHEFRTRWESQNVRRHTTGLKRVNLGAGWWLFRGRGGHWRGCERSVWDCCPGRLSRVG